MDEREELLELVMPLEDTPEGDEIVTSIQGDTPLTENQRNLLRNYLKTLRWPMNIQQGPAVSWPI